jgi:hypothetical protein
MVQALPRLRTETIPGADTPPPEDQPSDAIGQIINGVNDLLHGDHEADPQPPPQPRPSVDEAPH